MEGIEAVIQFLASQDRAGFSTDHRHIIMKCPVCGDPTSPTSKNFSVSVDTTDNKPFLFQCFRANCDARGFITSELLQQYFGCRDVSILLAMSSYNRGKDKSPALKINKRGLVAKHDVKLNPYKTSVAKKNLDYINQRLGMNITPELAAKEFKIVPDIRAFAEDNHITLSKMMNKISDDCIGFLSAASDILVCRVIPKGLTKNRYYNEKLIDYSDWEFKKYYIKPARIDLLSPEPTTINIAEGIISILGAYNVLSYYEDVDAVNNLFVANNGSGYYRTIATICRSYGITRINLNIYGDADYKTDNYKYLLRDLSKEIEVCKVRLHLNTLAEDFGYPPNKIKISTHKL